MTLYSNGCPRCKKLKEELDKFNAKYNTSNDFSVIINAGFKTVPVLEVNNEFLGYDNALKYIREV